MAYSILTNKVAQSTDSVNVTSSAIDTTGASLLILYSARQGIGVPTITDSAGNSWQALTTFGAARHVSQFFFCEKPITSATHTFTSTGGGGLPSIQITAFSNSDIASPFDVQNGNAGGTISTTGTSIQPNSITPNYNNELVMCGLSLFVNVTSLAIDSGFTMIDTAQSTANAEGISVAYIIQTTAGAVNPTWSWTTAAGRSSAIASFKASSFITGVSSIQGINSITF